MGIETAIIGSAILGAGASAMGASKQSKAAKQAAAAQQQSAQQAQALQKEIYYDQRGLQQPYYQAGLQGLYGPTGVMALLGNNTGPAQMGGAPQAQNALAVGGQPNYASGNYGVAQIGAPTPQSGPNWSAYLQANPDVASYFQGNPSALSKFGGDINKAAEYHYNTFGKNEGRQLPQYQQQAQPTNALAGQTTGQVGTAQPANVNGTPTPSGQGAMTDTLRQTPGYQFLQDESKRQIENSFASRGKLLSGGAMNALNDRTLGIADQTYQQAVNNQFQVANLGMGAAAQTQAAGNSYANGASNALMNSANATANGAYGQANAWNAGAQGVAGAVMGGVGAYGAYNGWGGGGGTPAATAGTYNGLSFGR